MNAFVHLRQYLAEFFLKWEMFQPEVLKKIKTRVFILSNFFRRYGTARQATNDNIIRRMRIYSE
jgi:hypothetical protein